MQPDEKFFLNHLHLLDPVLCAGAPLKPAVEGKLTVLQACGADDSRRSTSVLLGS